MASGAEVQQIAPTAGEVIESLPYAVVVTDAAGRVSDANRQYLDLLGLSGPEVLGHPLQLLVSSVAERFVDPAGLASAERVSMALPERQHEDVFELLDGRWLRRASAPISGDEYKGRIIAFQDVSERVGREHEVKRLAVELVRTNERERSRLAGELHDGAVQTLAASLMRLDRARGHLDDPERLESLLDDLSTDLRKTFAELRSVLFNLRPESLATEGLAAAVHESLSRLSVETGVKTSLRDDLGREVRGEQAAVAYRVIQEALANVRKHADAAHVTIVLRFDGDDLRCEVADDGRGFEAGPLRAKVLVGHLGLVTMEERVDFAGGAFALESSPGRGTRVRFSVPAIGG